MTAWSGLFDNEGGSTHALLGTKVPVLQKISKLLNGGRGNKIKDIRVNGIALNGTAAGGATTGSNPLITPADPFTGGGGVRTIGTNTFSSGVSAADDETEIDTLFTHTSGPTYVADKSGNGSQGAI